MGYYIECPSPRNKASYLLRQYPSCKRITSTEAQDFDFSSDLGLICVVENGFFDAAGYIFSPDELQAFSDPNDDRRRTWLTMPKVLAESLSGYNRKTTTP